MKVKLWLLLTLLSGLVSVVAAPAQSSADDFYKGKTIRFVVGLAPGGGYDLSARTVGRHLGKHVPGNPTIIVENMTGAGSLIAANYTYNSGKPDGLFVGIWNSALVLRQAWAIKRCGSTRASSAGSALQPWVHLIAASWPTPA